MTTAQLAPSPVFQFFGPNGLPLAGGMLYSYAAGTSTPQATYPSSSEVTPNTNPIILSSFGTANLWLDPTLAYKLNLTDASGNQIPNWPVDNIQGSLGGVSVGSLIPSINNVYTLGSPSFGWAQLYLGPNSSPAYNSTSNIVGYYGITAAETTAGITPTNYSYPFGDLRRYSNVTTGNGVVDDTTVFNNWIAAIKGYEGYLPTPSVTYTFASGFTISGHTGTKIVADTYAKIITTQSSGYAITLTNCTICDFDFGYVTCGYSGILMNSTINSTTDTKVRFTQLLGSGRQSTKPTDPMANRIGVYIQGPTIGNANYYHSIYGKYIFGFDTSVAFQTPSGVGAMNSNANVLLDCHMEGFWFGFYTNSAENQVIGGRWFNAAGTDASHITECVLIGDGTYGTSFNHIQGVAEPGTYTQAANCTAASFGNKIIIQDNCDHGVTDSGTNQFWTHNAFITTAAVTLNGGLAVAAPGSGDSVDITAPNTGGDYGLNITASGASSAALKIVGTAAGTPTINLNTQTSTGSKTITFTLTGFPGTNAGAKAIQYIPVTLDGGKCWIIAVPD